MTGRPGTTPRPATGSGTGSGPAPGSDVPGAPPALRRDLTPQDGVALVPPAGAAAEPDHSTTDDVALAPSPRPGVRDGGEVRASPYLAAVGLTVAAITIWLGTWRRSRHPRGGERQ